MSVNPSRKHWVLLGAGRAHMQVLRSLARQGSGNLSATLVAPHPYYIESALLPGYVAGDHALDALRIPIDHLVEASGAGFVPAHVVALDPVGRRVQLSSGDALPYDVLSVNTEPVVAREQIERAMPGARRNALFIHPLENFVHLWPQLLALAAERALQVAVVGHSLLAIELAMAAAHALGAPHGSRITLVAGDAPLLAGQPPALQRRVLARLKHLHITVLHDHCAGVEAGALQLASGASLLCDAPLLTIGAATPAWLTESGLQLDEAGEPLVNERLQSDSHRQIFIVPSDAPPEFGTVLDANLRTAVAGGNFRKAPTEVSRLRVLSCGNGHAIAAWGPLGLEGREVGHWKDRRDRRQLAALFSV